MMKYGRQWIALILLSCCQVVCAHASPLKQVSEPVVNALAWRDTISLPAVKQLVEQNCHAKLMVDQYDNNTEFERLWLDHKVDHDLIIFSNAYYPLVASTVQKTKINLQAYTRDYLPAIQTHYQQAHYPINIVYYMLNISGFLLSPEIQPTFSSQTTLTPLFRAAHQGLVVLPNDAQLMQALLARQAGLSLQTNPAVVLTLPHLKQLLQQTQVVMGRGGQQLYQSPHFAFAYDWAGALLAAQQHTAFRIVVHPRYSFVSADLLAQVSTRPAVSCTVKTLLSPQAMAMVQRYSKSYPPIGNVANLHDKGYQTLYQASHFKQLTWLSRPSSLASARALQWYWQQLRVGYLLYRQHLTPTIRGSHVP